MEVSGLEMDMDLCEELQCDMAARMEGVQVKVLGKQHRERRALVEHTIFDLADEFEMAGWDVYDVMAEAEGVLLP